MKILLGVLLAASILYPQKILLPKHIYQYLHKDNPFYYQAIGEQYVTKGREDFYKGALDTQINAKYDDKSYPKTSGTYKEVGFLKPLENGIELSMIYRQATGKQEYNNIITGEDGEYLSSIKIPLYSVLYNISKNKVDIQTARISTIEAGYKSDLNLLNLYFNITKIYYQLLLQKQLVHTQEALLDKAKKTRGFIEKQVEAGNLARVMQIEIEQMIIQREQKNIYARNDFKMIKNIFLQYLGIKIHTFNKRYRLPLLKIKNRSLPNPYRALHMAIKNRPDLKIIDFQIEKIALNKSYNDLQKYPKLDMKISGLYDPINQEGYKVSLNFHLPIGRRKYSGMNEVLQKQNLMKESQKLKAIKELETSILNVYQKIKTKKEAISLSKKELILVHKLESVEMKKIHEGIGNLIFLNQREIAVLKVEQKILKDYYDLESYFLEVDYLLGKLSKHK